jgi:gas vesicle protein
VQNIDQHQKFFSKEFKTELEKNLDNLNDKLKDIDGEKEGFFNDTHKKSIEELFTLIGSARQIEEVVFKSVGKMESLKQSHEDSALIYHKIKEISGQQDKISEGLDENISVLDNVNTNIKENVKDMKKNIEFIKKRIEAVKAAKK